MADEWRQTDDKIKDGMRKRLEGEGRGEERRGHCLFIMAQDGLQLLGSNRGGLMETPLPALCSMPPESRLGV